MTRPNLQRANTAQFVQHWFWRGAFLQTTRSTFQEAGRRLGIMRRPKISPSETLQFPMADGTGDVLLGSFHVPPVERRRPAVIVVHGLPGNSSSEQVLQSCRHLNLRGYPVLRIGLRGSGSQLGKTRKLYHAGRTGDVHEVIQQLELMRKAPDGILLLGFSFGGNLVLKLLGEPSLNRLVIGGASVSAPIDLTATTAFMLQQEGWKRLFQTFLLAAVKKQFRNYPHLTTGQRNAIRKARSFREFDELFFAPFSGFRDAQDYYQQSSACQTLSHIRVPTLLMHSKDDPFVTAQQYLEFEWRSNSCLTLRLESAGGHAGFHTQGPVSWHDLQVVEFFESVHIAT